MLVTLSDVIGPPFVTSPYTLHPQDYGKLLYAQFPDLMNGLNDFRPISRFLVASRLEEAVPKHLPVFGYGYAYGSGLQMLVLDMFRNQ